METGFEKTANSEMKKQCFVIMPFSQTSEPRHTKEYWDWFFEGFIKKALEE